MATTSVPANWCERDPDDMPRFDAPDLLASLPNVCFHNLSKSLGGDGDPRFDRVVYEIKRGPTKRPACAAEKDCVTFVVHCRLTVPVLSFDPSRDFPPVPPAGASWPGHKDWNGVTDPCESELSKRLGTVSEPDPTSKGQLVVDDLVMLFEYAPPRSSELDPTGFSWRMRGIHAGNFVWSSTTIDQKTGLVKPDGRVTIVGRMAGTNGTGIHRSPAVAAPLPAGLANDPSIPADRCADCSSSQTCNAPELIGRLHGVVTAFDTPALRCAHVDAVYRMSYDPGVASRGTRTDVDPFTGTSPWILKHPSTVGRGVLSGVLLRNC